MPAPRYVENEEENLAKFILSGLAIGGVRENKPLSKAGPREIEDCVFDKIESFERRGPEIYKGDALAFALVGMFGSAEAGFKAFNPLFQAQGGDPIEVACKALHITEDLGRDVSNEHCDGVSAQELAESLIKHKRYWRVRNLHIPV